MPVNTVVTREKLIMIIRKYVDPKMLTPPNRYEDRQDLPSKPQHDKTTKRVLIQQAGIVSMPACTGQESQYEPLRLKTMNKPSEYQEIGPKWKAHYTVITLG